MRDQNINFIAILSFGFSLAGCMSQTQDGYFAQMPTTEGITSPVVTPPPGNSGGTTVAAVKSIKPVFAVRGVNCMFCHGQINANVVTDFGYGTANFTASSGASVGSPSGSPHFVNNLSAYNNNRDAWQTTTINGTVYIPQIQFDTADALADFGLNQSISLKDILSLTNMAGLTDENSSLLSTSPSMISGVTPPVGQSAVVETSALTISYPSKSEIQALLPSQLQSASVAVSTYNVTGLPTSVMSGLVIDSATGKFVRNTGNSMVCKGDVVVAGPLLLKNLNLQTDDNGCRLYVSGTVFIQGPINYVTASGTPATGTPNLQISSASAVIMGISLTRMGYPVTPTPGVVRIAHEGDNNFPTQSIGGNRTRFPHDHEINYDPANTPINGIDRSTFFDNIVLDGVPMGAELVDAGDTAVTSNPPAGTTAIDVISNFSGSPVDEGNVLSINYSGLLLNAPHVQSRYAGEFKGVIIAEVVFLARNPDSVGQVEQFSYDPVFNSQVNVLPALTTDVLTVTPVVAASPMVTPIGSLVNAY